jgi:hypothetical protein
VSSQQRVAFFELEGEFPDELLASGVLSLQASLFLGGLMALKGFGRMGQKLVPPLVVRRLADLVLSAELSYRLTFEAFNDNHSLGLGIPFSSLHG